MVVDGTDIRKVKTFGLVFIHLILFFKHFSVAGPDLSDNLVVVLDLLALEVLDSNVRRRDRCVEGPLRWDPLLFFEHFPVVLAGLLLVDEA